MRALLTAVFTLALLSPMHAEESPGLATCKGDHPCKACHDCSACRYCHKLGGYCGVCSRPIPETPAR